MPVGQRAPTINMSKILRQLGYRTGQSRKITYYREPIYGKDGYGVETTAVTVNEIVIPNVQAYIRTQITKDFVIQKGGGNIVGSALIYLPRLNTLKNYPNFDQGNNIYFNEIEGWDKIIDKDRTVYTIPTSGAGDWSANAGTVSSDGETVSVVLTTGSSRVDYLAPTASNTLEANRFTFQVRADTEDAVSFDNLRLSHGGIAASTSADFDTQDNVVLLDDTWLTVDLPFASGTGALPASSSSVYQAGERHNVAITSGSSFDYKDDFYRFRFELSDAGSLNGAVLQFRNMHYYKAIDWSVHAIRDYTDEYMCLECVRTAGKRDSLRRAYA
tara:strand:+ start:735 stop:1721 length:987 start_codon:yes stop_codon:yes gene_type:complete